MSFRTICLGLLLGCASLVARPAQATNVYINSFDTAPFVEPGVSAVLSGPTLLAGVQGWVGLGTGSNTFDGQMLGNQASGNPAAATQLTLTNLPAHNFVTINFLLAMVDSWDGAEGNLAGPDYLLVTVDGATILRETFASDGRPQSYVPPAGVQLAKNIQLGYVGGDFKDSAYDMGLDPRFQKIPHTNSSLTISWRAFGEGYEGGTQEWFALDNVGIATVVPEPSSFVLLCGAALGLAMMARRRQRRGVPRV